MHFQNLPINRCNPSPETTISQVTTYHCFCSPHQKIYSFVYFPLQLCFPVQQNHISVQKIERAAKSATLPYAFYIFEVLMSPLRFGRCKTDIHRMSCTLFVVWFTVTPFRIFIPQRNQVLLHPVRFDSSMAFVVVYFCNTVILNGIKKILSIEDYMCKSSCYLVFFIKS